MIFTPKKKFILFIFTVLITLPFTVSSPQNASKEKILTLKNNQILDYTETRLSLVNGRERIFYIYYQPGAGTTEQEYFVRSGDKTFGPIDFIKWIDYDSKSGGYYITYLKQGKEYVIFNDKEYGPFVSEPSVVTFTDYSQGLIYDFAEGNERVILTGEYDEKLTAPSYPLLNPRGNAYSYTYRKGEKSYVRICGKDAGPFHYAEYASISADCGFTLIPFVKKDDLLWYISVNGKEEGPYTGILDRFVSADGKSYFYSYNDADYKIFFNLNGKTYGPYDEAPALYFTPEGVNGVEIKEKDGYYFIMNGKKYGPYDETRYGYSGLNNEMFYAGFKKGNEFISFINGKEILDGKDYQNFIFSLDGESYICSYTEGNKKYVIYNGEIYGPFEMDANYWLSHESDAKGFIVTYYKDNMTYLNINNTDYGPFGYVDLYRIKYGDNGGFILTVDDAEYSPRIMYNGEIQPVADGVILDYGISPDGKNWYAVISGERGIEAFVNGKSMGAGTFGVSFNDGKIIWFSLENDILYLNKK
ncbi:MAG: hypothetical protein L6Q59_14310 [Ignavibacteriaceae bacterium]|nr:hypothetical protein [Ignavibacteriaceae bacterium]